MLTGASPIQMSAKDELGMGHEQTDLYFHFPPDPVNTRTLNFYLPVPFMTIPCYKSIEIKGAYNSYSGKRSILGHKWTFNHNLEVVDEGSHFTIREGDGFSNPYYPEVNLEKAKKALAQKLVIAKKKDDVKKGGLKDKKEYAAYEKKVIEDEILRESETRKYLVGKRKLAPGTYYSFGRGRTTLEKKKDNSYVRHFPNAAKEFFDSQGRITKTVDRNGNYLTYFYTGDNLLKINDMCGRYVEFDYYPDKTRKNLVNKMTDSTGRVLIFTHNGAGELTSYEGPISPTASASEKKKVTKVEYTYDKKGNMTAMTYPHDPSQNIRFEYNEKYEVKSEIGPGDRTSLYKRTLVGNDLNNTITEIIQMEGGKKTGRTIYEYKLGEFKTTIKYDADGKQVEKSTEKKSEETGFPVSILDDKGQGDLFEYNPSNGNLLSRRRIPSGKSTKFSYDERCNNVTSLTESSPGKPLKTMKIEYDKKCNLVSANEKLGDKKITASVELKYTDNGKPKFMFEKIGNVGIAFTYWKFGKPESITLKDVGTLLVKYDPYGTIVKVDTFPHGKGKERFKTLKEKESQGIILREVRKALDGIIGLLRPAGVNLGI